MNEARPAETENYRKLVGRVFRAFLLLGMPIIASLVLSIMFTLSLFQMGLLLGAIGVWWAALYVVVEKKVKGV